ncbi:hypothetical protein JW877_08205 [bacterium]|nr:hypothetical protein [bacterium]
MFIIPAKCPYPDCGVSLMTEEFLIKGQPSIKLIGEYGSTKRPIYISSIYDDYESVIPDELLIVKNAILDFYCPHCGRRFSVAEYCDCGAPKIYLAIASGGKVKFCTRKGCIKHSLEFKNSEEIDRFYKYNEELRKK